MYLGVVKSGKRTYMNLSSLPCTFHIFLEDESQYYKRRKEDEKAFLVARNSEWMLSPFQCENCWFVNLCDRLPVESSPHDVCTLALL